MYEIKSTIYNLISILFCQIDIQKQISITEQQPLFLMNLNENNIKRINDYQFNLNDQVGKGFSSKVYKGSHITSKEVAAIKAINSKSLKTEVQKQLLNNQIKALRLMTHDNIIHLNQIYQTSNNIYIITELCKSDLSQQILAKGPYSQNDALRVVKEIAKALAYLNKIKIIHRDVKSSNILINEKDLFKLADFGFCEFQTEEKDSKQFYNVGSPLYMSPQAYKKTIYSHKSDMWALGIVFLELLKGKNPFQGLAYDQMIKYVMTGQAYSSLNIGGFSKMILSRLLSVDLQRRICAQQFLKVCQQQLSSEIISVNHQFKSRQTSKNITMTPQIQRHHFDYSRQKNRQNSLFMKKVIISEPHNQNYPNKIISTSKDTNKNRAVSPLRINTNRPLTSEIGKFDKFSSKITPKNNQSVLSQSPFALNKIVQINQTPKADKLIEIVQKNSSQILKQGLKKKMKLLNKLLLDQENEKDLNAKNYNFRESKQKLCILLYITAQSYLVKINDSFLNSLQAMNMKSMLDAHKSTILSFRIENQNDHYLNFIVKTIQQNKKINQQILSHLIEFQSLICLDFYSKLFEFKYSFEDLQQNNSIFSDFGNHCKILQKFYIIQSLIGQINLQESLFFKTQQSITYARYIKSLQQAKQALAKLV